jgi:hypothetical protein
MAWPVAAREGALIGYGPDYVDMFRRVGVYILRIIKGVKAGDLPVQEPTKFPLLINAKSAKTIGVVFPPALLVAADEVIDWVPADVLGQKRTFAVQQRMSAKCQKQTSTVGSGIWAFALGDGRISLKVGTPSGSYVRVMKDRLATIYAKVLFFSTRPFKNEF